MIGENKMNQDSEISELLYVSIDKLNKILKEPNTELTFANQYYTPIILEKIEKTLFMQNSNSWATVASSTRDYLCLKLWYKME